MNNYVINLRGADHYQRGPVFATPGDVREAERAAWRAVLLLASAGLLGGGSGEC